MSKDRSPAMQFYFRQFCGDEQVKTMDLDTVGAHILLMCAAGMSSHGWKLPSNERFLRAQIQYPSDEAWKRIKYQLLEGAWKISQDGKWWAQDGLRRTCIKRKEFSAQQSERGKRGNVSRWHRKCDDSLSPDDRSSSASASATAIPIQPIPIVIPIPIWLPEPTWKAFVEMRVKMRAPLTRHASDLIWKKLELWMMGGQNPQLVLEQSIEHGWRGIFELKSGGNGNGRFNDPNEKLRQGLKNLGFSDTGELG